MRKIQQIKILELVKTLKEANGELKKQTSQESLCDLLAETQAFAIQIAEYIESVAGEGTKAFGMLTELCETLFEAYSDKSLMKHAKKLKALIRDIENSVRTDLKPNKIEVAFFPYKASMADSLQTIWEAAMADPDCEVVVCPIPYYELLPSRALGKMYYEGGEYPKELLIVNWREYDVEERRPDIIFTHYPYDDMANNATVHPNFYSERLREYTDLLCYVPYFVAPASVLLRTEYYGQLPGIVYADLVVVESEAVRQAYKKLYADADKKYGWNGQFGKPDKKFVALGSPKYDQVINAKREDEAAEKVRTLLQKVAKYAIL